MEVMSEWIHIWKWTPILRVALLVCVEKKKWKASPRFTSMKLAIDGDTKEKFFVLFTKYFLVSMKQRKHRRGQSSAVMLD